MKIKRIVKGKKRNWKWKRVLFIEDPYFYFWHFYIASPKFKRVNPKDKNIIWEDFFIPF